MLLSDKPYVSDQVKTITRQAQNLLCTGSLSSLADIIRDHRSEHAHNLLRSVAEQVLCLGTIEPVLKRFFQLERCVT